MRQSIKIKAQGTDITWSQICSFVLYFHRVYTQLVQGLGTSLISWIYHLLFFSTCNQEAVTQFTGPGGAIPGGSRRLPGIKDMDTLVELWRNIHCLWWEKNQQNGTFSFYETLKHSWCLDLTGLFGFVSPLVVIGDEVFSLLFPFQFSSVAQSCSTLCDPMNRSTPGLPEFTQTHVIQPSPPLSSPSPPAPNPSQHQSLFQWVNSLHEVAKVLEFQLQHQSFQWILRTNFL